MPLLHMRCSECRNAAKPPISARSNHEEQPINQAQRMDSISCTKDLCAQLILVSEQPLPTVSHSFPPPVRYADSL